MKKIKILILFICFYWPSILFSESLIHTSPVKIDDFVREYRFYPFQWIYPEYYYKAEVIRVKKEKVPPQGCTKVEFFGLTAFIPSQYVDEITRKHDIMIFKSKTADRIIMIKSSDSSVLCSEKNKIYQKDYCSAFNTPQEYNHKLFTLTPGTAETIGEKWIVHGKGVVFENAKRIEIYFSDKFMAYVKTIKDSLIKETNFSHEIVLFHVDGPLNSHITISFIAKDDTLLNHFISTIE